MTATILRADARSLPLLDASVDLVVTSPPYYALRSYTDGGEHYEGQIGSEATLGEYIGNLLDCTREWVRVLKPSGSIWVNLGDKYSSGNGGDSHLTQLGQRLGTGGGQKSDKAKLRTRPPAAMGPKSLLGLPWRYALACVDQLGLILRAEVIWSKPNGLPESVTDRVRRSHEQWFHFTVQPRYFSAVDEIREVHTGTTHPRGKGGALSAKNAAGLELGVRNGYFGETTFNPLGKLPGSVWNIPTQPLTVPEGLGVDHFAAFPMEWPRRIILGWSPAGICTACGEGRRPVVCREGETQRQRLADAGGSNRHKVNGQGLDFAGGHNVWRRHSITGHECACGRSSTAQREGTAPATAGHNLPPTRPAVVLDPFGGTGTTALVASALGRVGISIDMSADYCRLARWRVNNPGELARAMRVEKPEPVPDAQTNLLDLLAEHHPDTEEVADRP